MTNVRSTLLLQSIENSRIVTMGKFYTHTPHTIQWMHCVHIYTYLKVFYELDLYACDDIVWVICLWFMQMHREIFSSKLLLLYMNWFHVFFISSALSLNVCMSVCAFAWVRKFEYCPHLHTPFLWIPNFLVYACACVWTCRSANCHLSDLVMVSDNIRLYIWQFVSHIFMWMFRAHLYISTTKNERVAWNDITIQQHGGMNWL